MSIDIQKAVVGDTARVSRMWVHLALVSGALATAPTFEVVIDRTSASPDNQLPTYNFSVRQFSTAYWPGDSRTYGYADIVPFNDSFYPTSYSSYIGIYSSPDGASRWAYHGLALQHGRPGSIDAGGTATPSVAVTNGTVLLSYAAESQPGGQGTRFIALATASHPLGPFVKAERPLGAYGQCRSDDPQLVVRPGDPLGWVSVYHRLRFCDPRLAAEINCTAGDCIRHRFSRDAGASWSSGTTAWHAPDSRWAAPSDFGEVFDAKWASRDLLVLGVDHSGLPCPDSISFWCVALWLSTTDPSGPSSPEFRLAKPETLQSTGNALANPLVNEPFGPQLAWIQNKEGTVTGMSVATFTNTSYPGGGRGPVNCTTGRPTECRPYTHRVYPIVKFGP